MCVENEKWRAKYVNAYRYYVNLKESTAIILSYRTQSKTFSPRNGGDGLQYAQIKISIVK
jgi:hypothetical protein